MHVLEIFIAGIKPSEKNSKIELLHIFSKKSESIFQLDETFVRLMDCFKFLNMNLSKITPDSKLQEFLHTMATNLLKNYQAQLFSNRDAIESKLTYEILRLYLGTKNDQAIFVPLLPYKVKLQILEGYRHGLYNLSKVGSDIEKVKLQLNELSHFNILLDQVDDEEVQILVIMNLRRLCVFESQRVLIQEVNSYKEPLTKDQYFVENYI